MSNEFIIRNGFIAKDGSLVEGNFTATTISAATYYNLPAGGGGGASGISGLSGISGQIGPSGGASGISGLSGTGGQSGISGLSGISGGVGATGATGAAGAGFGCSPTISNWIISQGCGAGGNSTDDPVKDYECDGIETTYTTDFVWSRQGTGHYRLYDQNTGGRLTQGKTFVLCSLGVSTSCVVPCDGHEFTYEWVDTNTIDFYTTTAGSCIDNVLYYASVEVRKYP